MLRDRDAYGRDFAAMTRNMGMEEVLTAPRSPWQNPFVERSSGSTALGSGAQGRVVAIPQVGGLHHRYQRRVA